MFDSVTAIKLWDTVMKTVKRARGAVVLRTITYTSPDRDTGKPGTASNSDITLTVNPIVEELMDPTEIMDLDLKTAEVGDYLFWISPTDVTESQLKSVDHIIYGSVADGFGPVTLKIKEVRTPQDMIVSTKPIAFLVVAGESVRR